MTDQRYKKPSSERVAPNRHMAGAYRRAETEARKARRAGGPLSSTEDIVMQAVKLGYQIADEQILKGQDIARRLRGASVRSGSGDVGELVDQGLRLAKQMAILFVEWSETTAKAPSLLRAAAAEAGKTSGVCGGSDTPKPDSARQAAAAITVPVQVRSSHPTLVTVVLSRPLTSVPDVFPLFTAAPHPIALNGVTFVEVDSVYILDVQVPTTQHAGEYRGCAVEKGTGQILGTIVIKITKA